MARAFRALGFSIAATLGTAGFLRAQGVEVDTLVAKVGEEGVASDAVELIAQGKVQLVVNTPRGLGPRADGQHIRVASVTYHVPCLTTLAAGPGRRRRHRRRPGPPARGARPSRTCTARWASRGGAGPDHEAGAADVATTVGSVVCPIRS